MVTSGIKIQIGQEIRRTHVTNKTDIRQRDRKLYFS